jgi:hypothetical protein
MKHEKNEIVELYYGRLLKLVNNLQHRTTYNFLTIVFRFGLQPIYVCSNNMHEEKNLVTT